jgi:hypothetical protein
MLKIVKVARFSDICTSFSDIICIFAAESIPQIGRIMIKK